MWHRRILLIVVSAAALVAGCGGEPAPDMGSGELARAASAPTTTTADQAEMAAAFGEAVGAADPGPTPTTDPADVAAVEAVCQRVSILVYSADSMGPDLTDQEMLSISQNLESIGTDVAAIPADLPEPDAGRLDECVAHLDQLPL